MKNTKKILSILLVSMICAAGAFGAVKPAEKLLPKNTLAVVTFKDLKALEEAYADAPSSKMVKDPALQPFLKHIEKSFQSNVIDPIEKMLAIDLNEFGELCEGQLTFAIVPGQNNILGAIPSLIVLSDTGSKKAKATAVLTKVQNQLTKNEVPFEKTRIQGSSFIKIPIPQEGRPEDFPKEGLKALIFGLADSLLVIGTEEEYVNNIVVASKGGTPPTLEQNSNFKSAVKSIPANADALGWFNISPLTDMIPVLLGNAGNPEEGPDPRAIFKSLGVAGLKGMSFYSKRDPKGELSELILHVPASERIGLFDIFVGKRKPSGPIPNLPSKIAGFSRNRLDLKEAFGKVEKMITQMSPEMGGLMQFMMAGIGKDQDKNYDFKRDFIGNLGDDLITVVQPPEGNSLEDIAQQPQLFMISSSDPNKLLYSVKVLSSMIPNLEVKVTDFLGKRVLSADLPGPDGQSMGIYAAANKGYLSISQNKALLQSTIRGGDSKKNEVFSSRTYRMAVDKVGGTSSGLFGFEDPSNTIGPFIEAVKGEPGIFQEIIDNVSDTIASVFNKDAESVSFIDLSLLPEVSAISKYLGISVYAGHIDNEGFKLKVYSPDPEGL